jgi:hypothetical protein
MIYVEFYNQQNLMDFDKFTLENVFKQTKPVYFSSKCDVDFDSEHTYPFDLSFSITFIGLD